MINVFGEIINSYKSYLTIKENGMIIFDYLIIKGNIKNNGPSKVTRCLIKINIYDNNNNIVMIDKIYVYGNIEVGKSNNFHLMTSWPKSAKFYNLFFEEVKIIQ